MVSQEAFGSTYKAPASLSPRTRQEYPIPGKRMAVPWARTSGLQCVRVDHYLWLRTCAPEYMCGVILCMMRRFFLGATRRFRCTGSPWVARFVSSAVRLTALSLFASAPAPWNRHAIMLVSSAAREETRWSDLDRNTMAEVVCLSLDDGRARFERSNAVNYNLSF